MNHLILSWSVNIPFFGDTGGMSADGVFVGLALVLFSSFFLNLINCFWALSSAKLGGDGGGDCPEKYY